MGTFHTSCKILNHTDRSKTVDLPKLLVDTGSEYTWVTATVLENIGVNRGKKTFNLSWRMARLLLVVLDLQSFMSKTHLLLMKLFLLSKETSCCLEHEL